MFRGEGAAGGAAVEITETGLGRRRQPVVEIVRTPGPPAARRGGAELSRSAGRLPERSPSRQARTGAAGSRQQTIGFPGALEAGQGSGAARRLAAARLERARAVTFAVAEPDADIVPGALVRLPGSAMPTSRHRDRGRAGEEGLGAADRARRAGAVAVGQSRRGLGRAAGCRAAAGAVPRPADGRGCGRRQDQFRRRGLAEAMEKPGASSRRRRTPASCSAPTVGQPADLGVLIEPLRAGVCGRTDRFGSTITVELFGGELSSVSRAQLLNGANVGRDPLGERRLGDRAVRDGGRDRAGCLAARRPAARPARHRRRDGWPGAEAGADLSCSTTPCRPAGLLRERGGPDAQLAGRAGGLDLSDGISRTHAETGGLRALLPLSPVHLRAAEGRCRRRDAVLDAARPHRRRQLDGERHSARRGARGIPGRDRRMPAARSCGRRLRQRRAGPTAAPTSSPISARRRPRSTSPCGSSASLPAGACRRRAAFALS